MLRESVTIQMTSGFESHPIAMLVQVASQFSSEIHLESGTRNVNAKSIMGMMTLGIDAGDTITVITKGPDEEEAMNALKDYLIKGKGRD